MKNETLSKFKTNKNVQMNRLRKIFWNQEDKYMCVPVKPIGTILFRLFKYPVYVTVNI